MLAALALAAATGSVPALTDPYAILANARAYWQAERYPAMVDYTIHTQATDRGKLDERHYDARWYADSGRMGIHPVSWEEEAHPYIPGTGFNFGPFSIGGPHDGGGFKGDVYALPLLAPNYMFGIATYVPPSAATPAELVESIREQFHDPAPDKVAALAELRGPRVIATVTADRHDYVIQLVGIEAYGDHSDYHLHLRATTDPGRYRLRDLWLDGRTFATDKLIAQGNFAQGAPTRIPWSVTFADVGGARYIAVEKALAPLRTGYHRSLADFTVSFESIVPGVGRFWPGVPDYKIPELVEPT